MAAAEVAVAGLDVEEFMTTKDPTVRSRIQATARAATELRQREAENLAVLIANQVGRMLGG